MSTRRGAWPAGGETPLSSPAWSSRSCRSAASSHSVRFHESLPRSIRAVEHQVLGSRPERGPGHDLRLRYSLLAPVANAVPENAPQPREFGVGEGDGVVAPIDRLQTAFQVFGGEGSGGHVTRRRTGREPPGA